MFETPSLEQQEAIRKCCHEDVNTRDKDLESIKEWLRKEPHLPDTWDDAILLNFLRQCKFSLETTKKRLDLYFTLKTALPEFFTDRDVNRPEIRHTLSLVQMGILSNVNPLGRHYIFARALTTDFQDVDHIAFAKIVTMCSEIRLKSAKKGWSGDVFIIDASPALFKNFVKVNPALLGMIAQYGQDTFPAKTEQVHVVNPTPFVDVIMKWVTPFLDEELKKNVYVHENMEGLYEYVPREHLPEEFGGTAGRMKELHGEWVKALEENNWWFKEQEKVKADGTKKLEVVDCGNLFGVGGSFKNLVFD